PVSLAATLAIAFAYATLTKPRRGDLHVAALTVYGLAAGSLLAAIQYVPLAIATRGSARALIVDSDFWTFHPPALIELLVPQFFGDYFHSNLRELAWTLALNSHRDTFSYTMYIGVPSALRVVLIAAAIGALAAYITVAWVLIAPDLPIRGFYRLALWAKVPAPIQGAEFLLYRARPLLTSLLLKLVCGSLLLWIAASRRRERRLALAVLSVFVVVDLLASNGSVSPTTDPRLLREPDWVHQLPPNLHERVYIGGRPDGYVNTADEDAPKYVRSLD